MKKILTAALIAALAAELVAAAPARAATADGTCDPGEACFYSADTPVTNFGEGDYIRDTTASQYTYFSQWDFISTSITIDYNTNSVFNKHSATGVCLYLQYGFSDEDEIVLPGYQATYLGGRDHSFNDYCG